MPRSPIRSRARASAPPALRRSHAERTARTRGRAIAAVVQSVAEVGFQRTTAAEISRRAGVTWGAVQHHFGGKDGILRAVLEEGFARFADRLTGVPGAARLEERVAGFVDGAWEHFASPHYRTTFEILANLPGGAEASWQDDMFAAWARVWERCFPESRRTGRRRLALMSYAASVLSGLATTRMLRGRSPAQIDTELGYLKQTLVRELRRRGGDR